MRINLRRVRNLTDSSFSRSTLTSKLLFVRKYILSRGVGTLIPFGSDTKSPMIANDFTDKIAINHRAKGRQLQEGKDPSRAITTRQACYVSTSDRSPVLAVMELRRNISQTIFRHSAARQYFPARCTWQKACVLRTVSAAVCLD